MSLIIEIEENNILHLYKELDEKLIFSETKSKNIDANSTKTRWILMNISFSKGKGDLPNEIPDVPG